jgi:hypothetical protein
MRLIHYTNEKFSLEPRKYEQAELSWQAKPNGIWFSVEAENVGYNWKEWCELERFQLQSLQYSYDIILKEYAKIIHLKTSEEIFQFTKKYPLKTRDWDVEWDTYQLEWNEVKKIYQGIIISPYQWPCRLSLESCWYYGWDCSCGCIWDLDCIEEFKLMGW